MISNLLLAMALQATPCPTAATLEAAECRAQRAYATGAHGQAAAAFEQMATLSSDPAEIARAHAAAAPLHALDGDDAAAVTAADAALAADALAPLQRGWTLLDKSASLVRLDKHAEAEAAWAEAGTLIDQDPFFWLVGAQMALAGDNAPIARARVDAGLELAPDSPELLLLSGQVALASENIADARAAFAEAARVMPDHHAGRAAARALAALPPQ